MKQMTTKTSTKRPIQFIQKKKKRPKLNKTKTHRTKLKPKEGRRNYLF